MTTRTISIAAALFASVAPVLAHGADSIHSPHPERSHNNDRLPHLRTSACKT